MVLGFAILAFLSGTSMLKSLSGAVGILLGTVGVDTISGASRYVYNVRRYLDGVGIVRWRWGCSAWVSAHDVERR